MKERKDDKEAAVTENLHDVVIVGAEFRIAKVLDMELDQDIKVLHTTSGVYRALGVILAAGANPRRLGFIGEKEFQGRGVTYCATCNGEFFTGMEVFVIGGGFAAVKEEKIEVIFNSEILEAGGEGMVSYVRFRNNQTDVEWVYKAQRIWLI